MIKTRAKPATKAGKRMMLGKEAVVKAKPANTVVKVFCVSALGKHQTRSCIHDIALAEGIASAVLDG